MELPVVDRNIPRVVGERVYLSLFRTDKGSLLKYMEWRSNEETCGMMDLNRDVMTPPEIVEWVNKEGKIRFGIVEKEDELMIGYCSINELDLCRSCRLSMNIGEKAYRGKGYGGEALDLLLKFCFVELTALSVRVDVLETNKASLKVLESRGFQVSGRYRNMGSCHGVVCDWLHLDILKEEYESRKEEK
jgi:RimJ/RimL family protein N-acetyltransferase